MEKLIIDEMLIWINANIPDVNSKIAAEKSGYSIYYFQRIFKRVTGHTLGAYILDRKMELAYELLLNTDNFIYDIALSLGYSSQQTFHRSFKKYFNFAPGMIRRCDLDFY